jgi:hypothetical protein
MQNSRQLGKSTRNYTRHLFSEYRMAADRANAGKVRDVEAFLMQEIESSFSDPKEIVNYTVVRIEGDPRVEMNN